jgi:hypothetical protein
MFIEKKLKRLHCSRYLSTQKMLTVTSLPFLPPQQTVTVTSFLMFEKSGRFPSLPVTIHVLWEKVDFENICNRIHL